MPLKGVIAPVTSFAAFFSPNREEKPGKQPDHYR